MFIPAVTIGLALILAAPSTTQGQAAEQSARERQGREVDLRPRLTPGRETNYRLSLTSNGTLTGANIEPGDGDQSMHQEIGLRVIVERVDDAGAVVKVAYESIKVRLRSPIADVDFDSSAPDRKPAPGGLPDPVAELLADALRRASGTVLTLTMDPSGAITSVTGGESLDLGSSIGVPGISLPGGGGQGLDWLAGAGAGGGAGGGPGVRHMGERWSTTSALSGTPVGGFTMTTNYELRSATASLAKVSFKGRIESPSLAPAAPPGKGPASPSAQVDPSGYEGSYDWDLRKGELDRMDSTMRIAMRTSAMGDPVTMNSDVVMKVERKAPGRAKRPAR